MDLEFFLNDRYRILQCMVERQVDVKGQLIVPLSQQDIADMVKLSKKKVNIIIGELKSSGYILQHNPTRGKYLLTDEALQAVRIIQVEEAD
ncbi:MAG: helix-turn-helix domain-containing protein [Ruminiclostridium sp.]|nr:helix-turn-helix domain-containing protein [Ruminiclostridium sp.]